MYIVAGSFDILVWYSVHELSVSMTFVQPKDTHREERGRVRSLVFVLFLSVHDIASARRIVAQSKSLPVDQNMASSRF